MKGGTSVRPHLNGESRHSCTAYPDRRQCAMSQWSQHRMNKAERRAYVSRRSRELAESGDYDNWLDIETHLVSNEGFLEAREWLDSRFIREQLDAICSRAKNAAPPRGST
jgi:hypothetical protein